MAAGKLFATLFDLRFFGAGAINPPLFSFLTQFSSFIFGDIAFATTIPEVYNLM